MKPSERIEPTGKYGHRRYSIDQVNSVVSHHHLVRNGRTTHVVTAGSSTDPGLLLLHGMGGSWATWSQQIVPLARTRFVIVPDLPGHGTSDESPENPTFSADYIAHTMDAFCDEVGVARCTVVGLSMGGLAAIHFPLRNRQRFGNVLLVSGLLFDALDIFRSPVRALWKPRVAWNLAKMVLLADIHLPERWKERTVLRHRWIFSGLAARPSQLDSAYILEAVARGSTRRTAMRLAKEAHKYSYLQALSASGIGLACLSGEEDGLTEPKYSFAHLQAVSPESTHRIVAGASHWLLAEYSDFVADQIEELTSS